MDYFLPSVFDRLLSSQEAARTPALCGGIYRITLGDVKYNVARDVEKLLNTRAPVGCSVYKELPISVLSLDHFGLPDFSGMSLASPEDRLNVCWAIKRCIERWEGRLSNVQVVIKNEASSIGRLGFEISAVLSLKSYSELISFDAQLDSSSQAYHVSVG
jgi:type VI secretion system protein ImpF